MIRRSILLWVTAFFVSGCYVLEQAQGQLTMRFSQVPISEALENEAYAKYHGLLRESQQIREFALEHILLKNTQNYTDYYHLETAGITYVVTAAPKLELTAYTWWFPIVGSVPYKGFFDRKKGRAEKQKLLDAGYEVWDFEAGAYSTLGWFRDPVITPMLNSGRYYLADILIHEMTHATLYIEGEDVFNEQLASFVARKGSEQYFTQQGESGLQILAARERRQAQGKRFGSLMQQLYTDTKQVYTADLSAEEKYTRREQLFAAAQEGIRAIYPGAGERFLRINNARLLQYRRYSAHSPVFDTHWETLGRDWQAFWQYLADNRAAILKEIKNS